MNPVYPGKDVSYIDTKQAQRAAETAVLDAERLATLAWLAGAPYPAESLDKAWRQLVFGAHHDAITGTESDQVYLDLLGGWREAWERGDQARRDAAGYLSRLADTSPPGDLADARPVAVFNTLSWPRSGLVTVTLQFPAPGPDWITLRDQSAAEVPFLAEEARRHGDGTLAGITLIFRADVPAVGYRTYWACAARPPREAPADLEMGGEMGWETCPGTMIENDAFLIQADPGRGGTLSRILDKRTGTDLLRSDAEGGAGGGNELVLQDEYDQHPRWGEGPWLLSPKGPGTGSAVTVAKVVAQRCPIGARLVAELALGDLRITQETLLWDGGDRIEFRTHADGSIGHDRLLRVRFPARVPGGLPVYQSATAVVGRPFGAMGSDAAEQDFTLDNPAHEWFGLGAAARVALSGPGGRRRECAIGVAEVILPEAPSGGAALPDAWRSAIRDLVAALAGQGVTATCSRPDGPRYGSLDLDSNLPDWRIALGGPEQNPWTARLLAEAGSWFAADLDRQLASGGFARVWVPAVRSREHVFAPGGDVRGSRDLPVLIVAGDDLAAAIAGITGDLADSVIEAPAPPGPGQVGTGQPTGPDDLDPPLAGHSIGLLNRGTPSSLVTPDGTLHIALMRSCSGWPSGVWIDGEKRAAPDGSSFAWQHWSHTFEYALTAGAGDWREAGLVLAGQEYNHSLLGYEATVHPGPLGASMSLCAVHTPDTPARPSAMLGALKPRGNPLASGRSGDPRIEDGVTARLRDAAGRSTAAVRVSLFTGIASARLTGLVEDGDGLAVPVTGGQAVTAVPAAGTVTLALTIPAVSVPASGSKPSGSKPSGSKPSGSRQGANPDALQPEPAQPVFTRYWLHGKGPAPAGNLPVAVHLSPSRIALASGMAAAAVLRLTVACGPQPASGMAELDVPDGLIVDPPGPLRYRLGERGHGQWDLTVRARPGAAAGRYFLAARIGDDLGQALEDAALVTLGEPAAPVLDLPLDELLPLLDADQQAVAAEIDMALLTPALRLPPGGNGQLAMRLTNHTASPIRGEAQLISSFGSWAEIRPWTLGVRVDPGGSVVLRYAVTVPADARPGREGWALVKLMYFGRVRYTEALAVSVAR
jgi:hypothetical protein